MPMYDPHKLVSFKQIDHDMTSFIVQAQSAPEELKMFLEVDSLEEIKRLDKSYLVMILRLMHPNFDRVWHQILTSQEIPSIWKA